MTWAFAVELTGLVLATALYLGLRPYRTNEHSTPPSLRAIGGGIVYAFRRRDLLATYLVDMVGMFLAMPIVLFPAFATEVLQQPKLLGLLYSAEAIGAMCASLTSGWAKHVHHQGRAVVLATICWGAAVGIAGLAPNIWFAIAFFAVAGAADMVSVLFRSVIWNQTIPDEMRGRLAGHRDARLLPRSARRPGPFRPGRGPHRCPDGDRQRWRSVRRRRDRDRGLAARVLAVRRPHRRTRGPRKGTTHSQLKSWSSCVSALY